MTCTIYILAPYILYFNSRPHEEVDIPFIIADTLFNISTHDLTKRSTIQIQTGFHRENYFNSRPHEEVDCFCTLEIIIDYISTHDLTKRSTIYPSGLSTSNATFQLTTSRRGRRRDRPCAVRCINNISTHDLTKRSTAEGEVIPLSKYISTHDLTKRSTQYRS